MDSLTLAVLLFIVLPENFKCEVHELKTTNFTIKANEHFLKFNVESGNATHNGRIMVDLFENLFTPTFDVVVTISHQFELLHRTFYFCNFVKAKNRNFVLDIFLKHVMATVNKDLLECPIRKGSYVGAEATVKEFNNQMSLPPFVVSGQEINFAIVFKSVIKRKSEIICSLTLDLMVS